MFVLDLVNSFATEYLVWGVIQYTHEGIISSHGVPNHRHTVDTTALTVYSRLIPH